MRYPPCVVAPQARQLLVAELLSVGTELTVGETRDTNAGDIARDLAARGVRVGRISAVPDHLDTVTDALASALALADLVVTTGGLGPTPDDLTREAIAALCGETAVADAELEAWLRGLWERRGVAFPEINLKQAWLIPSATPVRNANGTAPGWWVDRPDGRVVVALPGPPREMRPMWRDAVLPRLEARGLGRPIATRTYRLAGIGESQVAALLGEPILRASNPEVATYARAEAVDVRVSAAAEPLVDGRPGRTPGELLAETEAQILAVLGAYVWGRDDDTWADAVGRRLGDLDWTLATIEVGTRGALTTLLAEVPGLVRAESLGRPAESTGDALVRLAEDARRAAGADVGLALVAAPRGGDTGVHAAVVDPAGEHVERRLAFLGGPQGRGRAALAAAHVLLARLAAASVALPGPTEPSTPAHGARR